MITLPAALFVMLLTAKYVLFESYYSSSMFIIYWRVIVLAGITVVGYMYASRVTTIYAINPLEASICKGILSKTTSSAPLNRITNFELRRTFFKRLFGLADLYIDTPGTTEVELKMTELNVHDALEFRNFLSLHLAQQKIAEAGEDEELRQIRKAALRSKISNSN